jgi:hypothetical protein
MITLLAVLVGGFAGAIARQEGFSALQERASTRFPVGILAVNLSGAFVLGLLFGLGIASAWPQTRSRSPGTVPPGWPCSTWPDQCWLVSCSPGPVPASGPC